MAYRARSWSPQERERFQAFVRARMAEQRLQQKDLARFLPCDPSVISRLVNGKSKTPPAAVDADAAIDVERLAKALEQVGATVTVGGIPLEPRVAPPARPRTIATE
jgi:hypothetical protein